MSNGDLPSIHYPADSARGSASDPSKNVQQLFGAGASSRPSHSLPEPAPSTHDPYSNGALAETPFLDSVDNDDMDIDSEPEQHVTLTASPPKGHAITSISPLPLSVSPSPSPVLSRTTSTAGFTGKATTLEEFDAVARVNAQRQLALNRKEHVAIQKDAFGPWLKSKMPMQIERALRAHFKPFSPQVIFTDPENWYITFTYAEAARKAFAALHQQPFQDVTSLQMSLHQAPPVPVAPGERPRLPLPLSQPPEASTPHSPSPALARAPTPVDQPDKEPSPEDMVQLAKHVIFRDLAAAFEKDVKTTVIQPKVKDDLAHRADVNERLRTLQPAAYTSFAGSASTLDAQNGTTPDEVSATPPGDSDNMIKTSGPIKLPSFTRNPKKSEPSKQNKHDSILSKIGALPASVPQKPAWLGSRPRLKAQSSAAASDTFRDDASDTSSSVQTSTHTSRANGHSNGNPLQKSRSARQSVNHQRDEESEEVDILSVDDRPSKSRHATVQSKAMFKMSRSKARPKGKKTITFSSSDEENASFVSNANGRSKKKAAQEQPSDSEDTESSTLFLSRSSARAKLSRRRSSAVHHVDDDADDTRQNVPVLQTDIWDSMFIPANQHIDPFALGLAEDDEDLYYLQMALRQLNKGDSMHPDDEQEDGEADNLVNVHQTGSARTEGYYKIAAAQKSAYLPQRNRAMVDTTNAANSVSVSRTARAATRRLVLGIEQQRKTATSDNTDVIKFNQLRARKKQLKFAKSAIHDWGLYTIEHIAAGDMIVEYVGEVIRQQIADRRERQYERMGIGSSYLFRIDDDCVVDATKRGSMSRLINHSCDPNCLAKIITINGAKKIVIYARRAIEPGGELTYDYKFATEADELKIPCLCGAANCRKYLN